MKSVFRHLARLRELALLHGLLGLLRFLHDIALLYGLFSLCVLIEDLCKLIRGLLAPAARMSAETASTSSTRASGATIALPGVESIWQLAFSPVGHYLAYASRRLVCIYSLLTNSSMVYEGHNWDVTALAWSPDGLRIASASADSEVQVWQFGSGRRLYTYRQHPNTVMSLAWSPDGNWIASGGVDGTINIWSAGDGSAWTVCAEGHREAVTSLAWSPDGSCLLSGDLAGTVCLWDPATGEAVDVYEAHHGGITALACCPEPSRLLFATASYDGTVKIWDAWSRSRLFTYIGHMPDSEGPGGGVVACAWSPDGKRVISVDATESIHEWRASSTSALPLVCVSMPLPFATKGRRGTLARCLDVRQARQPREKFGTLMAVAGEGWLFIGPTPSDPVAHLGDTSGGRLSPLLETDLFGRW